MWITSKYQPTSLFSLRESRTTSSGAMTHIMPSPYSIKMAIIDVVLRHQGKDKGKEVFGWLKNLTIALKNPEELVINNSFIKIAKVPKEPKKVVEPRNLPFGRSVAFRQFVYLHGEIGISFNIEDLNDEQLSILNWALPKINYFGKRGSFFQFKEFIQNPSENEIGTLPYNPDMSSFPRNTYMQLMDDMAESLTFEKVDITSDKKIKDQDRDIKLYLFPISLAKSSKGYSLYVNQS